MPTKALIVRNLSGLVIGENFFQTSLKTQETIRKTNGEENDSLFEESTCKDSSMNVVLL